jgi:hypothetical protein
VKLLDQVGMGECDSCAALGMHGVPATHRSSNPHYQGYVLCEKCAREYDSRVDLEKVRAISEALAEPAILLIRDRATQSHDRGWLRVWKDNYGTWRAEIGEQPSPYDDVEAVDLGVDADDPVAEGIEGEGDLAVADVLSDKQLRQIWESLTPSR